MDSEPPSRHLSLLLPLSMIPMAGVFAATGSSVGGDGILHANFSAAALWILGAVSCLSSGSVMGSSQVSLAGLSKALGDSEDPPDWMKRLAGNGEPDTLMRRDQLFWCGTLFYNVAAILCSVMAVIALLPDMMTLAAIIGATIAIHLEVILLDVVARPFALRHPLIAGRVASGLGLLLAAPISPFVKLFVGKHVRQCTIPQLATNATDRDIRMLPYVQGVDRVVEEEAAEMIDSVREFRSLTAHDIMTPRTELEGLDRKLSPEEVYAKLRETKFSRLVVFQENFDHIVGVLLVKEVLLNRPADPYELIREPLRVPRALRLPDLLRTLRNGHAHLAVVVDEYGGTAGVVTLHNLFEQIVGAHIEDEEEHEELWIEQEDNDHARISGRVELWEVNEELGLELEESVARTIGGYLMSRVGRVPEEGSTWPVDGGVFRVEEIVNNRISRVDFVRDSTAREQLEQQEEQQIP